MEIKVYKSKKVLEVWEKGKLVKSYPIAVGQNEEGNKETEGDMRTPVGEYRVIVKNPQSSYYLSVGLNYPNNEDARRGLKLGLLTQEEHDKIVELNNEGKIPLWNTKMGGKIYIHGHLEKKNFTEGCVRMYDPDMKVIFDTTEVGTKVFIFP